MSKKAHNVHNTQQKGSFLLELLVAFAIISIALTVVVDSFITSQRSYRTTVEQAELTRILTRVLEDMTVEARVSENFSCGIGYVSPCTGQTFHMEHIEGLNSQASGEFVTYTINGSLIEKDNLGDGFVSMTPPSVVVESFYVEVKGDPATSDQIQALITLTAYDSESPDFKVHAQTSFTERRY